MASFIGNEYNKKEHSNLGWAFCGSGIALCYLTLTETLWKDIRAYILSAVVFLTTARPFSSSPLL